MHVTLDPPNKATYTVWRPKVGLEMMGRVKSVELLSIRCVLFETFEANVKKSSQVKRGQFSYRGLMGVRF